ncbi:MAG: 1-acyl-sn-glycerol-3-phosphate acyltransferase [Chlorobi bacterium]|nr:1-acyl-sn-glycerol-3-phosphate acyltransferase [Chlorobiota bacterium]
MKNKEKAFPTKLYIRFIVHIVLFAFTRFFGISKNMPDEVKRLKSPYLLLSNHIGFWDPFLVGFFLPHYTHFVSSDAAFRNPFFNFFLSRLGTIPKKKNMRDSKVIRDIVSVVRQGENVGVFPEAVRNWAGSTFPLDPSIAKLIRLLNVPVIVSVIKGMNLFNPRWSPHLRRTKVEIDYTLLFTKDDVASLGEEEIYKKLCDTLVHNEIEYQRKGMNPIKSGKRAEFINHALYVCPQCHAIDSFEVDNNDFCCTNCNYSIYINIYGFFELKQGKKLYFDNINDWYGWEEGWLLNVVREKYLNNFEEAILKDEESSVFHTKGKGKAEFLGKADISLFIDRIEIKFADKEVPEFLDFGKLQTINPQVREVLEIYYDKEAYRVVGGRNGVSALKWEVAMNAIWRLKGDMTKLSPYIDSARA